MARCGRRRNIRTFDKPDFEALARFRFGIRRYLRVSEEIVRSHDLTPQHYQLMHSFDRVPRPRMGNGAGSGRFAPAPP